MDTLTTRAHDGNEDDAENHHRCGNTDRDVDEQLHVVSVGVTDE